MNGELKYYKLKQENAGRDIENAIYQKAKTKCQYLGYTGKIILKFRNMVCIQDMWLQNYVKEVLSKPPPKVRKVLRADEMAEYNLEMMKLRSKIRGDGKLQR